MGYTGSHLEDYWPHELIREAAKQIQLDGIKKEHLENLIKQWEILSESILQGKVKPPKRKKQK